MTTFEQNGRGSGLVSPYSRPRDYGLDAKAALKLRKHGNAFENAAYIPALSPEFRAAHRPVRSEPKAQVTLRIDREVLDYFKSGGTGYQTRINDVLRSFVAAHMHARR
jgi:uncharacterized protein (DUF4415 family)